MDIFLLETTSCKSINLMKCSDPILLTRLNYSDPLFIYIYTFNRTDGIFVINLRHSASEQEPGVTDKRPGNVTVVTVAYRQFAYDNSVYCFFWDVKCGFR